MDLSTFARLAFLLFILVVSASSQGLESEIGENASAESTTSVPLDRRTKMFVHAVKKVSESGEGILDLGQAGLGLFDAFFASLSMILVSEVLSTGLGRIVPNLISRKHTNSAATVLYAFFGLRLLYIAWRSDSKASQKKEMEEVEEKLETGQGKSTYRRFLSRFLTPIFLELATHKNAVGVAVGATLGHTICTSVAVIGGSMLASKISQGTVATVGGLLFLGFSVSSYFYPPL